MNTLILGNKKGVVHIPLNWEAKPGKIGLFPVAHYTQFNQGRSPFDKLIDAGIQYENTTGFPQPNLIYNVTKKAYKVFKGHPDVDYVYALYKKHPTWFDGSSEEAFQNREAVINLAYMLLGKDWYTTLSSSVGCLGYYELRLFADALKEIGIRRFPHDEPSKTLVLNSMALTDYFSIFNIQEDYLYCNEWVKYNPQIHPAFDDIVFGEPNHLNTANLIKHAIAYDGIAYLVQLLNALYGTKIVGLRG